MPQTPTVGEDCESKPPNKVKNKKTKHKKKKQNGWSKNLPEILGGGWRGQMEIWGSFEGRTTRAKRGERERENQSKIGNKGLLSCLKSIHICD